MYSRLFSMTSSEFCKVDADTVLYHWDFKQFTALERYVDFCEDRRKWAEKGNTQDEKGKKLVENLRQKG